ncbi:hypothetical protein CCAX7_33970 [Capsulimonas corticalis]|uniref:Uncharacterized protein n=2 Tax=Capsulimonas corticalis TaxID=2219043 RepID=A0A402CYG3_9BACT|nr:hypothetical protein CCAX7_33970 [Capsulimonas corticalis]
MKDTFLETNAVVESVRQAFDGESSRPQSEWVRGKCPKCGDDLVSNCYYVGGRGYLICWECWSSLGGEPQCNYRKIL